MRKAKVIYRAPHGDSKVVEMGGQTFYDGKEVELNTDDHSHMINKFRNHPHFEMELGEDEHTNENPAKRRGRPTKRDLKAGMQEAADHNFEQDRRDRLSATGGFEPFEGEDDARSDVEEDSRV